jgi:Domain of unknown function (DUF1876)/Polyphosphate kinase C-terminal domain 1
MSMNDRWSVRLFIMEIDNETHAEARLVMPGEQQLVGRGEARRNPADHEVTLIGEQIAASRALSDLAGKVLHAAGLGIESLTHEQAHLHSLSEQLRPALVVRDEPHGIRRYVHVATGNYHEGTARLYEDLGLLSADPGLAANVAAVFNELTAGIPVLWAGTDASVALEAVSTSRGSR